MLTRLTLRTWRWKMWLKYSASLKMKRENAKKVLNFISKIMLIKMMMGLLIPVNSHQITTKINIKNNNKKFSQKNLLYTNHFSQWTNQLSQPSKTQPQSTKRSPKTRLILNRTWSNRLTTCSLTMFRLTRLVPTLSCSNSKLNRIVELTMISKCPRILTAPGPKITRPNRTWPQLLQARPCW